MFDFFKQKLMESLSISRKVTQISSQAEHEAKSIPSPSDNLPEKVPSNDELQIDHKTLLTQLIALQEQLETTFLSEQEFKVQVDALQTESKKIHEQHQIIIKKIEDENRQLVKKIQLLDSEKLSLEQQSKAKTVEHNEQSSNQAKVISELENQNSQLENQKKQLETQIAELKSNSVQLAGDLSEIKKSQLDTQKSLEEKLGDQEQQYELLQLQMYQLQEEVEELFLDKQKIQQSYEMQLARWQRLEKTLPNYIHFEKIELLSIDDAGDQTISKWRIHDYYHSDVSQNQLDFSISFGVENATIALGHDLGAKLKLCPQQVFLNIEEQRRFRAIGSGDWKKLTNIINILNGLISNRWSGLVYPQSVDIAFWQGLLVNLITDFKKLPQVMRYARVALKRELHNVDYEHLWLELSGIELGNLKISNLDLRIGAAMVRPDGFSRHPKFEFPLINRKDKPFESWYPESNDDQGPKYEVRYDLDRKAFDLEALKRLSSVDRTLVLNLILLTPKMVEDLIAQRIAIHRPWVNWSGLVQEASQLTSLILQNIQSGSSEADSKQQDTSKSESISSNSKDLSQKKVVIKRSQSAVKVTKKSVKANAVIMPKVTKSKARPSRVATTKTKKKKS